MIKLVLIGLAIWLLITIFKGYQRNVSRHPSPSEPAQDMVKCARCGVHLPKNESVQRDGQVYCSEHQSDQHSA